MEIISTNREDIRQGDLIINSMGVGVVKKSRHGYYNVITQGNSYDTRQINQVIKIDLKNELHLQSNGLSFDEYCYLLEYELYKYNTNKPVQCIKLNTISKIATLEFIDTKNTNKFSIAKESGNYNYYNKKHFFISIDRYFNNIELKNTFKFELYLQKRINNKVIKKFGDILYYYYPENSSIELNDNDIDIVIHYPKLVIKSEKKLTRSIDNAYFHFKIHNNNFESNLYFYSTSIKLLDIVINNVHPHVSGIPISNDYRYCLGNSSVTDILNNLHRKEISLDNINDFLSDFELLVISLKDFVSHESESGIPYKSTEDYRKIIQQIFNKESNITVTSYSCTDILRKCADKIIFDKPFIKQNVSSNDYIDFNIQNTDFLNTELLKKIENEIVSKKIQFENFSIVFNKSIQEIKDYLKERRKEHKKYLGITANIKYKGKLLKIESVETVKEFSEKYLSDLKDVKYDNIDSYKKKVINFITKDFNKYIYETKT